MRSFKEVIAFVAIAASVIHGSSATSLEKDYVLSISVNLRGEFTLETRPARILVFVDGSALTSSTQSPVELVPTSKNNVYTGDVRIATNHAQFTLSFDIEGEVLSERWSDSRAHVVYIDGGRADIAFNCTPSRKCVSATNKKGVIVDKYQQIVTSLGVEAPPEYIRYAELQELDEADEADLQSKENDIPASDALEYIINLAKRHERAGDNVRALGLLQEKRSTFSSPAERSHLELNRALMQLRAGQKAQGLDALDEIIDSYDIEIPTVQKAIAARVVTKLHSRSNDSFVEASRWVGFAHDPDDFSQKDRLDAAHSYGVLLSLGMAYWKSGQLALAENAFRQARRKSKGSRQREATRLYYEMMLERGAAVEVINDIGDLEKIKGKAKQALGRYYRMLAFEALGANETSDAEKEILLSKFSDSVYAVQVRAKEEALTGVQR